MLIEFTVENFRSFREAQTLRMDAAYGPDEHPENLIPVGHVPGMKDTHLLKVAAIYGPNASGKSNVYKAFEFLGEFVANSAQELKPGDSTGTQPFRLDAASVSLPSRFELRFVLEEVQHFYRLTIDRNRVHEETLDAFPMGRPRSVFARTVDKDGRSHVRVGSHYEKAIDQDLARKTRANASFVSVGAQWDTELLAGIQWWLAMSVRPLDMSFRGPGLDPSMSVSAVSESETIRREMARVLAESDLGIESFDVEFTRESDRMKQGDYLPVFLNSLQSPEPLWKQMYLIQLAHRSQDGFRAHFSLDEESAGTERLFCLMGPLLAGLNSGATLIVDEFDTSIHPQLAVALLDWFRNYDGAAPGAQLIFTTHDTSLMTLAKMRRDQFWFTEKHGDGATRLYPLTDYKPRKGESLSKGYLSGRYGAIPMVDDLPLVGKKNE